MSFRKGPEHKNYPENSETTKVPDALLAVETAEKSAKNNERIKSQCEAVDQRCELVLAQNEVPKDGNLDKITGNLDKAEQAEKSQLNSEFQLARSGVRDQLDLIFSGAVVKEGSEGANVAAANPSEEVSQMV